MSLKDLGPTTAATVNEARKDELDRSTSENTKSAATTQAQLISAIKAHIAKGDKVKRKPTSTTSRPVNISRSLKVI